MEEKIDKYSKTFLLISVVCISAFYMYDDDKFNKIIANGDIKKALVINSTFIKNDWNIEFEFIYNDKYYRNNVLTKNRHRINDTIIIKFEKDNPEGRTVIIEDESKGIYSY